MRVCCHPHPGFSPRWGPHQIPHQIAHQRFDFSTHFRCISRKTTKRDAFGWGRCQRKSGGAPWNQLWQIVRLGPKRVATGLVASIAVRHWRMDWGIRGAALGCTRGWAIYGGRREGDSSIRATWEQADTLSIETGRLSMQTGWRSR